uniref:Peptidase M12B domain-containing protein n=1 Tax=Gadus morhua TaxID=8049 RepID=A0A8C5C934_GADMO
PDQQNQNSGLVLVVDHAEVWRVFNTPSDMFCYGVQLYRSLGIRVMLVGLEIWTYGDQIEVSPNPDVTLERFMAWRQQTLLPRTKHDNAQFITDVDFIGNTVGLAYTGKICTGRSVAVNEDHNDNAIGVATTLAHEMGHNLGLSHDAPGCVCRSSHPRPLLISPGRSTPRRWSTRPSGGYTS